jgi:hypothetical protein
VPGCVPEIDRLHGGAAVVLVVRFAVAVNPVYNIVCPHIHVHIDITGDIIDIIDIIDMRADNNCNDGSVHRQQYDNHACSLQGAVDTTRLPCFVRAACESVQ